MMAKVLNLQIFILLLIGQICISFQQKESSKSNIQKSSPNDSYYIAGVVEYQPNLKGDVKENLYGYQKIIESTEAHRADIIVFPEATLNSDNSLLYVPDPKNNVTLCENTSKSNITTSNTNQTNYVNEINETSIEPLEILSCLAKKYQKYILINLSEKENCTTESQNELNDTRPCSKDGLNKYNTNVVFDRNGKIISRYRKWHLYSENNKNTTAKPEYATFTTDFNVTFGHFTCFDILFYTPTQELVQMGITDFLFPTMWFSELPFLTAVQQQRGWAFANDVNLLAAGASNPRVGSTGTGIYAGKKGALISVMNSKPERKIYVAKVPKKNFNLNETTTENNSTFISTNSTINSSNNERLTKLKLLRDNINSYNTTQLKWNSTLSTEQNINETICSKNLCCKFSIKLITINNNNSNNLNPVQNSSGNINNTNVEKSYEYVLAAYEGERTYQHTDKSYIRACSIIACTNNENITSCGTIFPEDVIVTNQFIFNNIQIEGNFEQINRNGNMKSLIVPSNLDDAILPLPVDEFSFDIKVSEKNDTNQIVKCELIKPKSNLLTFGIYGNDFKAPNAEVPNSSSRLHFDSKTTTITRITSLVMIIFIWFIQH